MTKNKKNKVAIGLMSGTSLDGIDVALIETDGHKIGKYKLNKYCPYSLEIKNLLTKLINQPTISLLEIKQIELEITRQHIVAVKNFLEEKQISRENVDIIGFHGQTILHNPEQKITWQIGNAQMLASEVGIDVVADFRTKDIVLGGQGAPLVPIYHLAIFGDYKKPLMVLNIGGVANITYIENSKPENLIAFDVCFGNAPLNDIIQKNTEKDFDKDGILASKGKVNQDFVKLVLNMNYFNKALPKSLDRNYFKNIIFKLNSEKLENQLATLVEIFAKSIVASIRFLPQKPQEIIVCGGGRKNLAIMNNIKKETKITTTDIDSLKINGDFIEAEAFAFLAVRHLFGLPISYPKTTGILLEKYEFQPLEKFHSFSCGGVFYRA